MACVYNRKMTWEKNQERIKSHATVIEYLQNICNSINNSVRILQANTIIFVPFYERNMRPKSWFQR